MQNSTKPKAHACAHRKPPNCSNNTSNGDDDDEDDDAKQTENYYGWEKHPGWEIKVALFGVRGWLFGVGGWFLR